MKKNPKLWLYSVICWIGTALPAFGSALTIPDQTLRYSVTYSGQNAGELEISIRGDSRSYTVTSTSHLSNLAKLLLDAYTSETRFTWNGELLELNSSTERIQGNEGYERSYRINRHSLHVEYNDGKKVAIRPDDRFEAVSFPLILMHRSMDGIGGTRVREVSAKRVRDYTYGNPEEDSVEVPAGSFSTWKVTRQRVDRPDSSVTVWLNKYDVPIPVKIMTTKKGKNTVLQLIKK